MHPYVCFPPAAVPDCRLLFYARTERTCRPPPRDAGANATFSIRFRRSLWRRSFLRMLQIAESSIPGALPEGGMPGRKIAFRCRNFELLMSRSGHPRKSAGDHGNSAYPPTLDLMRAIRVCAMKRNRAKLGRCAMKLSRSESANFSGHMLISFEPRRNAKTERAKPVSVGFLRAMGARPAWLWLLHCGPMRP